MTQWSDGAGPPAYGPPPATPYAAPGGPYGSPYGPGARPQRETGAMVVCVVLLVLALIGSFVASAAVHANITKNSSAAPGGTVPTVAPGAGGGAAAGGGGGGGGGAASPSPTDPRAQRHKIAVNFPQHPASRRVGSPKPYLAAGQIVEKQGMHFYVTRSCTTVYRWYRHHLGRDHLRFGFQSRTYYEGTHKLAYLFGTVRYPDGAYGEGTAQFDLQPGRGHPSCVVTADFYD